MSGAAKLFRVLIRRPDGERIVLFSRYGTADEARRVASALRAHGIDASAADPERLPVVNRIGEIPQLTRK